MQKFSLIYRLQKLGLKLKGYTPEDVMRIQEENDYDVGACDAMMLVSIVRPEDGGISIQMGSVDPGTEDGVIPDVDYLKIMAAIADTILDETHDAPQWHKELCHLFLQTMRSTINLKH